MNLAFYRMLCRANQDKPKTEPKTCGNCGQCSCSKPNPSAKSDNA